MMMDTGGGEGLQIKGVLTHRVWYDLYYTFQMMEMADLALAPHSIQLKLKLLLLLLSFLLHLLSAVAPPSTAAEEDSYMLRQQLIRECPILSNIEPKQIKVRFQKRSQEGRREVKEETLTLGPTVKDVNMHSVLLTSLPPSTTPSSMLQICLCVRPWFALPRLDC